jgi:hypothetical protein
MHHACGTRRWTGRPADDGLLAPGVAGGLRGLRIRRAVSGQRARARWTTPGRPRAPGAPAGSVVPQAPNPMSRSVLR